MTEYILQALCTFGLESLVADELTYLGFKNLKKENGKIEFSGDEYAIAQCNINLRTAERIVIKCGQFIAKDFEDLFQGTLAVKWEEIIPINGQIHVTGKSKDSKLTHVPSCQSIVKKAIIKALQRKYKTENFKEDGPLYKVEVELDYDQVFLTLDTTGPGLHKRGYRHKTGEAPLKETLAAALVILSHWDSSVLLVDPLCGSGTIAIEAALYALNIAPGVNRSFSAEEWTQMPKEIWQKARQDAKLNKLMGNVRIVATDKDKQVLKIAQQNARNAGVSDFIQFQNIDFEHLEINSNNGYLIANPPYGERIGEKEEVEKLYKQMGQKYKALKNWKFYILTSYPQFEKLFGLPAHKNRKLYNGNIKCYFYQYFK